MYAQAEQTIETIAENKARQFNRVAWLEPDDVKQEVRLKCYNILHTYNSSKGELQAYLAKCAEYRLRDIRRSLQYKHNPPCVRCPLWDSAAAKAGEHDCLGFRNKMDCDKYARHERYVQVKLSASHPVNINENVLHDESFDRCVKHRDLLDYVREYLPKNLMSSFDQLVSSNFNVRALKSKERVVLIEALVDILEVYYEEIYE